MNFELLLNYLNFCLASTNFSFLPFRSGGRCVFKLLNAHKIKSPHSPNINACIN